MRNPFQKKPTPQGNTYKAAPEPKKARAKRTQPSELNKAWQAVRGQFGGAWDILTGRLSLLQLIQENLLFTLFLTGIGLVYIWNSHQAERQARAATLLEKEIRDLKTEYMTLNAQLSISRQQSRVEELVDSLGLESPTRPPVKLEVVRE